MFVRLESFPATTPFFDELFGFDRGLESVFGVLPGSPGAVDSTFAPLLDVAEAKDEIRVVAELPGVRKEDIRISLEDGMLTISGQRKDLSLSADSRSISRERGTGKFSRSVRIPAEINAAGVSAELSDGLLNVGLPKAEAAKAHEITVR